MDFAEFIGANRHTIAIAQSYFGGVSVDIRFRLRLTGLPRTVAIGGFASAKQCHLKIYRVTCVEITGESNRTGDYKMICILKRKCFISATRSF